MLSFVFGVKAIPLWTQIIVCHDLTRNLKKKPINIDITLPMLWPDLFDSVSHGLIFWYLSFLSPHSSLSVGSLSTTWECTSIFGRYSQSPISNTVPIHDLTSIARHVILTMNWPLESEARAWFWNPAPFPFYILSRAQRLQYKTWSNGPCLDCELWSTNGWMSRQESPFESWLFVSHNFYNSDKHRNKAGRSFQSGLDNHPRRC